MAVQEDRDDMDPLWLLLFDISFGTDELAFEVEVTRKLHLFAIRVSQIEECPR